MIACKDCHFHGPLGEGKNGKGEPVAVGNCFRYPPQITVSGGSSYPVVGSENEWCGEFRATTKPNKRKGASK